MGNAHKDARESSRQEHAETPPVISFRLIHVLVSIAFIIVLSYVAWASELFQYIPQVNIGDFAPHTELMGILLLCFGINVLVTKLSKRAVGFQRGDFAIFFTILGVAGLVLNSLPFMLIISLMGMQKSLLDGTPGFWSLRDNLSSLFTATSDEAIEGFWRGSGVVPWNEWIIPMIVWSLFLFVLVFSMVCFLSLIRRNWQEHLHLSYPLVAPMISMTQDPEYENGKPVWRFWNDRLMWVGFLVASLFVLWEFVSWKTYIIPFIPGGRREWLFSIFNRLAEEPTASMRVWEYFCGQVDPFMVGIAYFLPINFLFSHIVFRFMLRPFVNLMLVNTGYVTHWIIAQDSHNMVSIGGFVAVGLMCLWLVRRDIAVAFRTAFHPREDSQITDEGLSPKVAIAGGLLSAVFILLFSVLVLGISPLWSIAFWAIYFLLLLAATRSRVEIGNGASTHLIGNNFIQSGLLLVVGGKAIGSTNLSGMNFLSMVSQGRISGIPGQILEGWKFGDSCGVRRQTIVKSVLFGFLAAFFIGFVTLLPPIHKYGASIVRERYSSSWLYAVWNWAPKVDMDNPAAAPVKGLFLLGGGVFTILLYVMKAKFIWWPLEPIAVLTAFPQTHWVYSGSFFIALVIKAVVMRWGGVALYKKLTPIFYGLVAGEFVMKLIMAILGTLLS
jgi:hypothetical protein